MVFPARLAGIDIGSNAIRLVAAEFTNAVTFEIIEQLRLPVRLGRSVFDTGELSEEVLDAAGEALLTLSYIIRDLNVSACRAVATSAARDARNGGDLVRRAESAAGIRLEIIDGTEEARLVHIAAIQRIGIEPGIWLLADIGGGSMEIATSSGGEIGYVESHPVGALRFAARTSEVKDDVALIRHKIDLFTARLADSPAFARPIEGVVSTGGSIDALARLTGSRPDSRGVFRFERSALESVIGKLERFNYEERALRFKLPRDRADVILPGAILYQAIAERAGASHIVAPQVGVKEGILLDLAQTSTHSAQ